MRPKPVQTNPEEEGTTDFLLECQTQKIFGNGDVNLCQERFATRSTSANESWGFRKHK